MHPLFLLPALLAPSVRADDLLVPEFTPAIAEDFTLAYMFYSLVVDELQRRGLDFVDGDRLRAVAGDEADMCGDSITCPSGLWAYFPDSSIALVGTVGLYGLGTSEESIEVRVDFFERDGYQPFKTVERTILPGQEADFAVALAKASEVLIERMATPAEPVATSPEPSHGSEAGPEGRRQGLLGRLGRDEPEPDEPALTPQDQLYKDYYDVDEGKERRGRERAGGADERVPREPRERAQREPRERSPRERSPRDSEQHLLQAQAFLGLAIGDVARSYDVRLSQGGGDSELGRYEHDSFTGGVGSTFGASVMVSPVPWAQAGLRLGVVSGRKFLSTGYERWGQGEQSAVEIQEYKPAPALRGLIEPRLVVAPLAIGPLRPSVHGFFGLRRYDGYTVQDLALLDYPERNGGWQLAPGGGLGAVWDLGEGRGVSLEISHAITLDSDSIHHVQQGLVTELPELPEPAGRTTTIAVGFTQGFL